MAHVVHFVHTAGVHCTELQDVQSMPRSAMHTSKVQCCNQTSACQAITGKCGGVDNVDVHEMPLHYMLNMSKEHAASRTAEEASTGIAVPI